MMLIKFERFILITGLFAVKERVCDDDGDTTREGWDLKGGRERDRQAGSEMKMKVLAP